MALTVRSARDECPCRGPLSLVPLVYSGQFFTQPGAMFAILTLITVPVVVVYFAMQKFMISGLTTGAVKG